MATQTKAFRKVKVSPNTDVKTLATTVDKNLDNLTESVNSIISNPMASGQLLQSVILIAGIFTNLNHGLGRNYVSWFPCNPLAPVKVFAGVSPDRSQFLTLSADTNCQVDIYVF